MTDSLHTARKAALGKQLSVLTSIIARMVGCTYSKASDQDVDRIRVGRVDGEMGSGGHFRRGRRFN